MSVTGPHIDAASAAVELHDAKVVACGPEHVVIACTGCLAESESFQFVTRDDVTNWIAEHRREAHVLVIVVDAHPHDSDRTIQRLACSCGWTSGYMEGGVTPERAIEHAQKHRGEA